MPLDGFEPTISVGKRLQTYAFDHAAPGTGYSFLKCKIKRLMLSCAIFWSYFVECQLEAILVTGGSHSLPYFLQSNDGTATLSDNYVMRLSL